MYEKSQLEHQEATKSDTLSDAGERITTIPQKYFDETPTDTLSVAWLVHLSARRYQSEVIADCQLTVIGAHREFQIFAYLNFPSMSVTRPKL